MLPVSEPFLGFSLTCALAYVWARRNPHVQMAFLGIFFFRWGVTASAPVVVVAVGAMVGRRGKQEGLEAPRAVR